MIRVTRSTYERQTGVKLPRGKRAPNAAEVEMARQLTEAGIEFDTEYRFDTKRKWRLDFAFLRVWTSVRGWTHIGLDIDGGCHVVREKWGRDLERSNALALAGWVHLRATPAMVWSGKALELVRRALT